jgi:Zn-dependent M28 family amino/carboxypeptidase
MLRLLLAAAVLFQAADRTVRFESVRAFKHLQAMVAIGPRPAGSPAIEQTRTSIKEQLAAAGVAVSEQAWEDRTPAGPVKLVNLIATIPGASKDRLIIAGHYDTKLIREFRFVGANDGGSSAAFLVEFARVLKARKNPLTMELLFLDGEEAVIEWANNDHTYGSRHYVEAARRDGSLKTIKALVLVDMIADRDLKFKRDGNSTTWLTDIIWSTARREKLGAFFDAEPFDVEDDHIPFVRAGVPAVDIIDLEFDAWHQAGDTLDAVSPRGLQIVGDVLLSALPQIESRVR